MYDNEFMEQLLQGISVQEERRHPGKTEKCLPGSKNEAELAEMEQIRHQLGTNFCRRCNYCAPCTVGISIPSAFLFAGYLERYNLADWAKDRYGSMAVKASACVGCGKCETRCPYHLPIREMLKKVAEEFGE